MKIKQLMVYSCILIFSGCAAYAGLNYDHLFGKPEVRERAVALNTKNADFFRNEVKPIIDNRCVVCHACYDAPCQLKMSSVEGIDRGSSKEMVYQGTRLTAAKPSRLFEDAQTTQEWRDRGFFPVLNEREQTLGGNLDAGLVSRMITQKARHPLPQTDQLEGFDFSISRTQVCPTIEEYDAYEQDNPLWGMPFGLPNIDYKEYETLIAWLGNGALMNAPIPLSNAEQAMVNKYETLLNESSLKNQLTARYIYEHLFLSHLYFSEIEGDPRFFTIVRSSTPPGTDVKRIVTRRPYDNPKRERVYYRLIPEQGTIVDKTHMPFKLNDKKLDQWYEWFIEPDYVVDEMPSYDIHVAANPMTAFKSLPVDARFNFMLDNAQNTIMAYIKGPVCRGQLALNVINDRFWVFFLDPKGTSIPQVVQFYDEQTPNLKLPSEKDSNTVPITNWVKYSKQQARYLEGKADFMNRWFTGGKNLTTDLLWKGNGENPNVALTVFRHFDSASVVQGMVGLPPKTAWILDYALLERIHYLLVAGFDVYGNFGHQLITRMFMDFLRMEGESNFLALLPNTMRHEEFSSWYKDQSPQFSEFVQRNVQPFSQPTQVLYKTTDYKAELFDLIKKEMAPNLNDRYNIVQTGLSENNEALLRTIDDIKGVGLETVPEIMMLMIKTNEGTDQLFTIIHNNAHTNISSLFDEKDTRDYANDSLTIVRGVVGSYPAAYFSITENDVEKFVSQFSKISDEDDYIKLLDNYAVRRTSPDFWSFSDRVHEFYQRTQPIEFGLLDYNRFENR
ncbi:fatty acid cis/trans isomerase [Vibrio sp. 10N.261.51.F12]|uniref:fatty acid cis/trans isomerase n=1 Tax=Vibrio sp. 10N.261.51.F12 TaxID=3229679 RepID=UPI00354F8F1C